LLQKNVNPRVLLVIGKSQSGNTISPPIGLYKLKNYLHQRNISCDVLAMDLHSIDSALEKTRCGNYQIIGFSLSHWSLIDDLAALWQFREAASQLDNPPLFIAGGQEAAMNAKQCLQMGIELIFLGFAEKTLYEFCVRYRDIQAAVRRIPVEEIAGSLEGLAYLNSDGQMVFREATALNQQYFEDISYQQLFSMEVPYREFWEALRQKQSDTSLGSTFVFEFVRIYTASHCPRRCGFCNSQSFLPISQGCPTKIIHLSADQISDLLLFYIDYYGARGFFFSDDDFPLGNKSGIQRVEQLCDLILEHKACGRMRSATNFSCQARIADFLLPKVGDKREVNIPLLKLMASAGFNSIAMGVETFSDRLLRVPSINKIGVNSNNCFDVLDAMLNAGMTPLINIILGIPEATRSELLDTLRIAVYYVTKGCEINVSGPLYALPGAPMLQHSNYQIAYRQWTHPETHQTFSIENYFIPEDALVAKVSANYETEFETHLELLAIKHNWNGKIIHKRAKNVLAIIVATRLLGDFDLADQFEEILDALIQKRLTAKLGEALLQNYPTSLHRNGISGVPNLA